MRKQTPSGPFRGAELYACALFRNTWASTVLTQLWKHEMGLVSATMTDCHGDVSIRAR